MPPVLLARLFPLLLMLLNLGAAVVCFSRQDVPRGCYWLASGAAVAAIGLW